MSDRPARQIQVRTFGGLRSNADPHDLDPSETQEQINLACTVPGRLKVRGGMRAMNVSGSNTALTNSNSIACFDFRLPQTVFIIYEQANGVLRAGRNPT